MPQLCIETFVSQYFWLVMLFFTFYWNIVNWAIPKISEIIKLRKELSNVSEKGTYATTSPEGKNEKKTILMTKPVQVQYNTQAQLDQVVQDWCKKKLK